MLQVSAAISGGSCVLAPWASPSSSAPKSNSPPWSACAAWDLRERLMAEKAALGFYLSGHLFDQSAAEVRRFAKRQIADLIDSREPQLLAGIVSDLRIVNGQRGRVAIFKLDDKSETIEAVANEDLLNANRELLRDDELVVVQGKVQPDRFSGGLRLTVAQVWDLAAARCRFAKHLYVVPNGSIPPVAEVLRDFPSRRVSTEQGDLSHSLKIVVQVTPNGAKADLDLGDEARFYPTDAALERWRASSHCGQAVVVYE